MLRLVCCLYCYSTIHLCILKLAMSLNSTVLLKFGKKVKAERNKQNISQEELASRADLHRTYIGMVERAERNITLLNIEKIANALGIKINELL